MADNRRRRGAAIAGLNTVFVQKPDRVVSRLRPNLLFTILIGRSGPNILISCTIAFLSYYILCLLSSTYILLVSTTLILAIATSRPLRCHKPATGYSILSIAGMGGAQNERYQQGNTNRVPDDLYAKFMFKIPSFLGYYDAEKYLDWEMTIEQKFSAHLVPEHHRVQRATSEFKDFAIIWWTGLAAEGVLPTTWEEIKKVCPSQRACVATEDGYISISNIEDDEEEEKKDEEKKDLSIAPCMLEECSIDQAPIIYEDENKGMHIYDVPTMSTTYATLEQPIVETIVENLCHNTICLMFLVIKKSCAMLHLYQCHNK
uniref:Retrotransposon protein, putative, Ty3-gypsy subclass n=1 Tax=Oryza sativa subsp. japonica TaxID=39947 RepID=Q2QSZ8_ORYSJ|nr:retrotransposon protein, putative, Ty3-gypsy subclass [Oryza sativa Japonica Group]